MARTLALGRGWWWDVALNTRETADHRPGVESRRLEESRAGGSAPQPQRQTPLGSGGIVGTVVVGGGQELEERTDLKPGLGAVRERAVQVHGLEGAPSSLGAGEVPGRLVGHGHVVLVGPCRRHDVGPAKSALLQTARDAARGRLLTLVAGLFAAGVLVFTALNFNLSRRGFELTEQGQVTDCITKAIEQLGSDKLDVRIGGIYALERGCPGFRHRSSHRDGGSHCGDDWQRTIGEPCKKVSLAGTQLGNLGPGLAVQSSGGGMGLACRPGTIQQDSHSGGDQGGTDRDQGDLPAGHATPGDEGHRSVRDTAVAAIGRRQRHCESGGRGGQGQHGPGQPKHSCGDASEVFHGALPCGR